MNIGGAQYVCREMAVYTKGDAYITGILTFRAFEFHIERRGTQNGHEYTGFLTVRGTIHQHTKMQVTQKKMHAYQDF